MKCIVDFIFHNLMESRVISYMPFMGFLFPRTSPSHEVPLLLPSTSQAKCGLAC